MTRGGQPVGAITSSERHGRLGRLKAYLKMLRLLRSLEESGITGQEAVDASREEIALRLGPDRRHASM